MRNFSKDAIIVRKTPTLTVIFYSPRVIYVKAREGLYLCDGWFAPKGYYSEHFKPFCQKLRENHDLSIENIRKWAAKHYVNLTFARSLPKITRRVEFLPSIGRNRGNCDDDLILKEIIFGGDNG